jgi:hypothetical protein
MEEWKTIQEFPNYEVSNLGNVRNKKHQILKPSLTNNYLHLCLRKDNKTYTRALHKLVCQTFIPNPFNKPSVDHIDSTKKLDNSIYNLRWADYTEQQLNKQKSDNHNISKNKNLFDVKIVRYNKVIYRKKFETLEEAVFVRDAVLTSLNQSYTVE